MNKPTKPWIIWVDYGSEGWIWKEYETQEEAMLAIGGGFNNPFVLTKLCFLYAMVCK